MKIGTFWHWQLTPANDDEVHMLKEGVFLDNATKVDVMWNETQKQLLLFCDGWYGTITLEEPREETEQKNELAAQILLGGQL
jgi:hypothetical protein